MASLPPRFAFLGSTESASPSGVWGWAKRTIDDLNKNKIIALGFAELTVTPFYNIRVTADGYGFELAPALTATGPLGTSLAVPQVAISYEVTGGLIQSITPATLVTPIVYQPLTIDALGTKFQASGVDVAELTDFGYNVLPAVGHGYFYNDIKVVGAQGAAIANLATSATANVLPTPNGTVVIADANAPTVLELLEYCVELEAKLEAVLALLRSHGLCAP